jgi:hypothetical protein
MKALQIALAYGLTALFQVGWHWFLSLDNGMAHTLLRLYLAYNPKLGKGVAPVVDVLLPSIFLGAVIGFLSWNWPPRRVTGLAVAVGVGLVALLPAYAHMINQEKIWWWPNDDQGMVLFFLGKLIQSLLVIAMLVYAGRQVGLHHHQQQG